MNRTPGKDSTVTIMVPYAYGSPEKDFKYTGKELDSVTYSKLIMNDYNKHKAGVYDTYIERCGYNMAQNNFEKENNVVTQSKFYFDETKVDIFSGNGGPMQIDELIHYYQTGEPFIIIIDMYQIGNPQRIEFADLQSDMRRWSKESDKINTYPKFSQAEKIQYLSKKTLKIKFDDARSSAILKNCKMVDRQGKWRYVFLVEKIIFVTG